MEEHGKNKLFSNRLFKDIMFTLAVMVLMAGIIFVTIEHRNRSAAVQREIASIAAEENMELHSAIETTQDAQETASETVPETAEANP